MTRRAGVVDGLLAGRYRLVHRLAAGGMGEVWQARDVLLHRDVAVKGLRPELVDDVDVRARFRAEAQSAGRLDHPSIAAVHDFVEDDEGAWLVMDLVDGEPLSTLLRREGRLTAQRTLDVVVQTAGALQAAHDAGVVHRDVKPSNLLVARDGTVSVTDFGIASAAGVASLTRTGELVGTAGYLSPEQASGSPATAASDLYALGVVAYECLAGRRPFDAENPVAVLLAHLQTPPPPLPEDVDGPTGDLVLALLAKDPGDRPPSAAELAARAAALRGQLGSDGGRQVVAPQPDSSPPRTQPLAVPPPPPSRSQPPAADAALPVDRHAAGSATGLAGRPGQRRAVRATALLLGLLAVGFGARGALESPAPQDASQVRPTPSPTTSPPSSADVPAASIPPVAAVPAPVGATEPVAGTDTAPASGSSTVDTAPDRAGDAGTAPGASSDAPAVRGNGNGSAGAGQGNGRGNGPGNGNKGNGSRGDGGGRGGGA